MSTPEEETPLLEESAYDRYWITHNLDQFARLARDGYILKRRGAILVNLAELILRRHSEEGHPFNYHAQSEEWLSRLDISPEHIRDRMRDLLEYYSPASEFLVILMRYDHSSIYRLPLPRESDLDPEIRGAYIKSESEERKNRLTCSDFWAREFRLTTRHNDEWFYGVA